MKMGQKCPALARPSAPQEIAKRTAVGGIKVGQRCPVSFARAMADGSLVEFGSCFGCCFAFAAHGLVFDRNTWRTLKDFVQYT